MMDRSDFSIREAVWEIDSTILSNIRRLVFILEQKVQEEEELDGQDDICWHWLATDLHNLPVGTCRLLPNGQVGRMAVLSEFRGHGIGSALLKEATRKASHLGFGEIYLHAQVHAESFYKQLGFKKKGREFYEAGILHYHMTKQLTVTKSDGLEEHFNTT